MAYSVIRKEVVAQAFQRLRSRRIHPHFAGYLCVCRAAAKAGTGRALRPNFLSFFEDFLSAPDAPIGRPYLRLFSDQAPNERNLWSNPNVAGSYAPSSLRGHKPFRKVVEVDERSGEYSLPDNHADLALANLLHGSPVPAVELAIVLYRDFGVAGAPLTPATLTACFSKYFGYERRSGTDGSSSFDVLFGGDAEHPFVDDEIAELMSGGARAEIGKVNDEPPLERVRRITSRELMTVDWSASEDRPALAELRVRGLLSFSEEQTFRFGRLNILVGPNGAGKSNLIDCLRVFRRTPLDIQQPFRREGLATWLNNGIDKETGAAAMTLKTHVPGVTRPVRHELGLGPSTQTAGFQLEEWISEATEKGSEGEEYFSGSYRTEPELRATGGSSRVRVRRLNRAEYDPTRSILSQVRDASQYPEITYLGDLYRGVRIYSEMVFGRDENPLREAAAVGRSQAELSESLADLPLALNAMERSAAHEQLLLLLREVKETYRDYITQVMFGRVGLSLLEDPFKLPIPATRLSDGTLRFLALAAILLPATLPPVICLEEPELGMHPDMVRMVGNMLIDAAPRTQLIVTTHSEHLLTALEDDFDVLFAMDAGLSGSVVRPFTREQFQKWRQDHRLGELWTTGQLGGNRW